MAGGYFLKSIFKTDKLYLWKSDNLQRKKEVTHAESHDVSH